MVEKIKRRKIKKFLKKLTFRSAPLSTNKGRVITNDHCPNKLNSKERRHRGWITAKAAGPGKYSEMFEEANEPPLIYDPWQDGKDGIHFDPDETHIRSERMLGGWKREEIRERNEKLKRYYYIRKSRKYKQTLRKSYSK